MPAVTGLFPAGGQQGSEFDLTATGTLDPWPLTAVCDDPQVVFTPDPKTKGKYRVSIDAAATKGPRLVRFHNAEGAAPPRIFLIGAVPERTQKGLEITAVLVDELPLLWNGKFKSGGAVDRYSLELRAGQRLMAEVLANVFDSPVDPMLHLRGPRGDTVAFNHDGTRDGIDPRLVYTVETDGMHELHLSAFAHPPQANIRFTGGATALYRLGLSVAADAPAVSSSKSGDDGVREITAPAEIEGSIAAADEVDQFRFESAKGERLRFEVNAGADGSRLDPVLVIENADGKEVGRHDDIDGKTRHDVALDWTAPEDGVFVASVSDLNQRADGAGRYRFLLTKPEPHAEATIEGAVFAIKAGGSLEIATSVARRYGLKAPLELTAEQLPEGVTAERVEVSEKGGAVKLILKAVPDAPVGGGFFEFSAGPPDGVEGRFAGEFKLKGSTTDVGDLLINQTHRAWLTVLPAGEAKEKKP